MMDDAYSIDRSDDCFVYPNATDKPLSLYMHHFNRTVVIVNQETGDVLSQSFSRFLEGSGEFFSSPRNRMKEDLFFDDPGQKIAFVLEADCDNQKADIREYLSHLESRGVAMGGSIACGIDEKQTEAEELRRTGKNYSGEIGVSFLWDLKNPTTIQAQWAGGEPQPLEQQALKEVGTRPTQVPEMKSIIQRVNQLSGVAKYISWAHEGLETEVEKHNVDINELFDMDSRFGKWVAEEARYHPPFDKDYLYHHPDDLGRIEKTLKYLQGKGLKSEPLAVLISAVAEGAARNMLRIPGDPNDFLIPFAHRMRQFAQKVVEAEPDIATKEHCAKLMYDDFRRLAYAMRNFTPKAVAPEKLGFETMVENKLAREVGTAGTQAELPSPAQKTNQDSAPTGVGTKGRLGLGAVIRNLFGR